MALLGAFGFPFRKGADDVVVLPKRSSRRPIRGGRPAKKK